MPAISVNIDCNQLNIVPAKNAKISIETLEAMKMSQPCRKLNYLIGNEVIDVQNAGESKIAPSPELPRYMFPYKGHQDYMSPFIALKLYKPVTGVVISMTCRLWARNIVYKATKSGLNDTMINDEFVPSAILPFIVIV